MQYILNTGFGIFIAAGLWVIGVPNAVLWGIFAGLMRLVPFIGGFIAAFFPIVLAAAVDPGWSMVLATAALFLVAEPLGATSSSRCSMDSIRASRRLPSSSPRCSGHCCGAPSACSWPRR